MGRRGKPGPRPGDRETSFSKRIDARQSILDFEAADVQEMGFYPKAFCQIGLPVSPPKMVNEYNRDSGPHHLSIMAPAAIGVPWGAYPRGILAWLVTDVVKRKNEGEASRTVNLGNDLLSFMSKVTGTLTYSGGKTGNIRPFKKQLASLLASRIYYWYGYDPTEGMQWKSMEIAPEGSLLWAPKMADSPGLFQSSIVLHETFWKDIITNAVPIDSRALKALWPSCLAMDLYIWLTYKAHSMKMHRRSTIHISWRSLHAQFGPSYANVRKFKQNFNDSLVKVRQVYPYIDIEEKQGSAWEGPKEMGLTFAIRRPSIMSITAPRELDQAKVVSTLQLKPRAGK